MKIELTEEEIKILYRIIMSVSWQGDSLELGVSIKNKIEETGVVNAESTKEKNENQEG